MLESKEELCLLDARKVAARKTEGDDAVRHQRIAFDAVPPNVLVSGQHGEAMVACVLEPLLVREILTYALAIDVG